MLPSKTMNCISILLRRVRGGNRIGKELVAKAKGYKKAQWFAFALQCRPLSFRFVFSVIWIVKVAIWGQLCNYSGIAKLHTHTHTVIKLQNAFQITDLRLCPKGRVKGNMWQQQQPN